jgi:acetylornithine deacetylase/succinyl-diaminopimelate desuccinylase-like protein
MPPVAELLSELVRVDSVNPSLDPAGGGEGALAALVARFLEGAGFAVERAEALPGRPNVVATLGDASAARPALLFACHLDTVPLGAMRQGLVPEVRDGALFGRGACDVKGGLAAMLTALAARRQAGRPLMFWGTVDEEHDFAGVRALARPGVPALGAVVAEPTRLRPVLAHKGCVRLAIRVRGRAAHSARPEAGENAILHALRLVDILQAGFAARFPALWHPLCGHPVGSVTQIGTDNPINVIPDSCRLGVDLRLLPGQDPDELLRWLGEVMAASGIPLTWEVVGRRDHALDTDPRSPVARWALGAAAEVLRTPVTPQGAPYGTDASKIAALAGVPAVVLGPGDIAWAHTGEERIPLHELEQAVSVYEGIIDRYLAGA